MILTIVLLITATLFAIGLSSQYWREIKRLESTLEEIKKVNCSGPDINEIISELRYFDHKMRGERQGKINFLVNWVREIGKIRTELEKIKEELSKDVRPFYISYSGTVYKKVYATEIEPSTDRDKPHHIIRNGKIVGVAPSSSVITEDFPCRVEQ